MPMAHAARRGVTVEVMRKELIATLLLEGFPPAPRVAAEEINGLGYKERSEGVGVLDLLHHSPWVF